MTEAKPYRNNERRKLCCEFIGTFLLVFTLGCNVLGRNTVWGGVSIGAVLMVAIYAMGWISGGNFNPAVSLALGLTSTLDSRSCYFSWRLVLVYSCVQVLSGVCAAVAYSLLFWETFNLSPATGTGWVNAGLCEMLYTFALCFVVLNVVASKRAYEEPNQFYGLAIGFVVVAGAYGAGTVTGGCFNPAVAIGIELCSIMLGFGWSLVYVFFELAGAALAALLFRAVRPGDFQGCLSDSRDELMPKLLSEFIGTYMLVLTVGLNVLASSPATALSVGASLACMVYALADVSGAHFNPGVTVAVLAIGQMSPWQAASYVLVQLVAGVCGALTYAFIYAGSTFPLTRDPHWIKIGVAETIFTFLLVFVVLCVAYSTKNKQAVSQYFGLAIGACVAAGGFAVGGISGAALNPAVSSGIASADVLCRLLSGALPVDDPGQWDGLWQASLYGCFELGGGLLAAAAFAATHGLPEPAPPLRTGAPPAHS